LFCAHKISVSFSTSPHVPIVSSAVFHDPVRTPSQPLTLFAALTIQPDMDSTGPPGVSAPKIANEGDNDVAPEGQPSQFLLIRGLAASVTEELLAKGVSKLYRPSGNNDSAPDNHKKGSKVASTTGDSNLGAREGSLRRVLLVRDRRTNESWGYGFAEFAGITVRLFYSSLILVLLSNA
jgi:hypothetical protein